MNPTAKSPIKGAASIVVIWVIALVSARLISSGLNSANDALNHLNPKVNSGSIQNVKTELQKYAEVKESGKSITVLSKLKTPEFVSDFESNSKIANDFLNKNSEKFIFPKTATGYLYISASVDGASLGPKDSIYLYLDDSKRFGGHIDPIGSLPLFAPAETKTELVFPLEAISFAEGDPQNWLSQLQKQESHYLGAFISTTRKQPVINEIIIYYKASTSPTTAASAPAQP